MTKQVDMVKSQHDLFYALEAALRGLRVGYDSKLAFILREQHKLLVMHDEGCGGCVMLQEVKREVDD